MGFTLLDFLMLLLIAAVCGGIGQALAGTARGGFLASIALGFIGAVIGCAIARAANLPELFAIQFGDGGPAFPVIWAIIGAALFMAVLALFTRPYRRY